MRLRVPLVVLVALCGCLNLDVPDPLPPATVSGLVIDPSNASAPVSGARVTIDGVASSDVTGDDGLFAVGPLVPGHYTLNVWRDAQNGAGPRALRRALVVTRGGQLYLGELALRGTGEITGRVTLAGAATGNAGISVFLAGTPYQSVTGDDGTFHLVDVPEGSFSLVAMKSGYESRGTAVDVVAGQVSQTRTLDLPPGQVPVTTISGTLALVRAEPSRASNTLTASLSRGNDVTPVAQLDVHEGSFSLPNVEAGVYRLAFVGEGWRPMKLEGLAAQGGALSIGVVTLVEGEEPDADGDGVPDALDDCATFSNAAQLDLDGDGRGDGCDPDVDGDGARDELDNCLRVVNPSQSDIDADGLGDACDDDRDGDLVPDVADNCPAVSNVAQLDADGDGVGDACDDDRDGDGVTNALDNCPSVSNANQLDGDGDGVGDACAFDRDGDGISDSVDNCPSVPNVDQLDTDLDGFGNACDTDLDSDGVSNAVDNCPNQFNPLQDDTDHDALGDVCDDDLDGDGVANTSDNCVGVPNADQADDNGNDVGNLCDPSWVAPGSTLPVITSFSPAMGLPGSTLTLTGANFDAITPSANQVSLNGVTLPVVSATATQLTVTVASTATTGFVVLRTLTGTTQTASTFRVLRAPVISDVQPRSVLSGGTLTVYGSDFEPGTGGNIVKLGGTTLTVTSATTLMINATVPVGTTTGGQVAVTSLGGTATTGFSVAITPPPTVTQLSPNSGVAGSRVLIYGTNFGTQISGVTVKFNGTPAVVSAVTNNTINTTVPSGATTGTLLITTPSGAVTSGVFTIDPQLPTIGVETGLTYLFPGAVQTDSERTYTLTGNNFAPIGSLRMADGRLVAAEDGGTPANLTFVVPTDWAPGSLTYVRGDGAEATLNTSLHAISMTTQALNPVPELFVQRGDRARWYGSVGNIIYLYDGTTLQQTAEPPFDDGAAPGFIVPTSDGLYLATNNGRIDMTARTKSAFTTTLWQSPVGGIFYVPSTAQSQIGTNNWRFYMAPEPSVPSASGNSTPGYSGGGFMNATAGQAIYPTTSARDSYDNLSNGKTYIYSYLSNYGWQVASVTPSGPANGFTISGLSRQPTGGWWVADDQSVAGNAAGADYTQGTWSVTLPEASLAGAVSIDRKFFVMRGATRLMIVDLTTRKLAGSLTLTVPGTVRGFFKEFDRDEWVVRTDDATATLNRFTLGP